MGIRAAWDALLGRDVKAARVQYGSGYQRLPGTGLNYLPPQAQLDYGRLAGDLSANSVVAVCLGWLADNFPSAKLQAGRETDDGFEADLSHRLTKWFTTGRPNPYYSWRQVWGATSACFKVDGNAYWVVTRGYGGEGYAEEAYWLPNQLVQVETTSGTGEIVAYRYTPPGAAKEQEFAPQDVIHFRDAIDPANPIMGISRLKRCIRNVAGLNAGETYTAAILRNYGVPSYVLVPKAPMNGIGVSPPEEAEMLAEKRRLNQNTAGENAGKSHAVTIPVEYVRLGQGPEELMLDRILDRPESVVCAALGLNSLVTGLPASDASRTYSNLGEANKQAWENAIIPMQDTFAEILQNAFSADFADGMELRWDRSRVAGLSEDTTAKVERAVSLFQAGLLPQNRALDHAGLDPVEGGDERYTGDPTPAQEKYREEYGVMPGEKPPTPPGAEEDADAEEEEAPADDPAEDMADDEGAADGEDEEEA
jgi:phage portal protein BeeE